MTHLMPRSRLLTLLVAVSAVVAACGGSSPASGAPSASAPSTGAPSASAAPTAAASSPATGAWVVVAPEGGGFTVEMPGEATFQTQTAQTDLGPIELHLATFGNDDGAYFASWSDYPAGSITDPVASLLGARDGAVQNINGTLVTDGPIEREGLQGHSLTATVAGGTYQAEIFLDGDRIFQLGIASADGATGFDADRFFASFKRTG